MANESKFEIKGNFLVVTNITTRWEYFRVSLSGVKFTRMPNDEFIFMNSSTTVNNYGAQGSNILGVTTIDSVTNPNAETKTNYSYADSVDKDGLPFDSADDLDIWLSEKLGGSGQSFVKWGEIGGDITDQLDLIVELDSKIEPGDNVSELNNDAGYVTDRFEERWDQFSVTLTGAFHTIRLPGSPSNRVISVLMHANVNNTLVGVRATGSSLLRVKRISNDSSVSMNVKSNINGEIEVYTTNINADFFIESYQN